jgi:hypothetical protein
VQGGRYRKAFFLFYLAAHVSALAGFTDNPTTTNAMKATTHFVDQLTKGAAILRDKHGAETLRTASPWAVFFAISAALCQGQRHHVDMDEDERFRAERKDLKDTHIETATKAAIRAALASTAHCS